MHKCIAGFPDAGGYRRADPLARQRRPPLFAALCNNLPLAHRLPYNPLRATRTDRRWGERVEGTSRERVRVYLMTFRETGGVIPFVRGITPSPLGRK